MPSRKRPAGLAVLYAQREGTYRDFAVCIRDLIAQVVAMHGITVHSVTCRAKTQASLKEKLAKDGKSYRDLSDITDLAGVRIITHFTDDAEAIAKLVEAEFDVDADNSVDKRRLLEPNEFGYLSIHHIASLPERRAALAEYSRFKGLKVEIQTRSILQHAWAEIEHDLGYKSTTAIPRRLRRRISRLAGLLELADQEFQTVRDEIGRYERDLPQLVLEKPQGVEIDKSSLEAYVKLSDVSKSIDQRIADALGSILTEDAGVDYAVTRLNWLGLANLAQVDECLRALSEPIVKFATEFLTPVHTLDAKDNKMSSGMSVFYLAYVLVGQRSPQAIEDFVVETIGTEARYAKRFAEHIAETLSKVTESSRGESGSGQASPRASSSKPTARRR